jgi:hypothetical protein
LDACAKFEKACADFDKAKTKSCGKIKQKACVICLIACVFVEVHHDVSFT